MEGSKLKSFALAKRAAFHADGAVMVERLLANLWDSTHVWYYAEELFAKEGGKAGRSPWHQDT